MATYMILQGIHSSIGASVSGIFSTMKMLYQYNNTNFQTHLRKLDIEYKLKMVSTVLHQHYGEDTMDIKDKSYDKTMIFTLIKNEDLNSNDLLELSLNYLSASVKDIFDNLIMIQRITANHKEKWFHAYRAINIKTQLENLEINIKNLDARFDNYIRISKMISSNS